MRLKADLFLYATVVLCLCLFFAGFVVDATSSTTQDAKKVVKDSVNQAGGNAQDVKKTIKDKPNHAGDNAQKTAKPVPDNNKMNDEGTPPSKTTNTVKQKPAEKTAGTKTEANDWLSSLQQGPLFHKVKQLYDNVYNQTYPVFETLRAKFNEATGSASPQTTKADDKVGGKKVKKEL